MPGGGSGAPAGPAGAAAKEAKAVRTRLAVSFAFTIPLFYISMGHMFGWPLPAFLTDHANVMAFALTQFLLLLPVIFVNFRFFRVGFKALAHRSPNMDSLIALGSAASTVYGVYALYRIALALGAGDLTSAHVAAMDLYFESAAMILTLITLGKYFEARAKGKTTDAITKLMDLSPKTATRLVGDVEETVPATPCASGRRPGGARRRSRASGRDGARRRRRGRRVGRHGGERAGREGAGQRGHGSHGERVGLVHHACGAGGAPTPPWRASSAWWTMPPAPRRPSRR